MDHAVSPDSAMPAPVNPLTQGTPTSLLPQPCVLVIFGAAGDLAWRKLLPAVYNVNVDGLLPSNFAVVGFGVGSEGDPDQWLKARARDGIEHFSRQKLDEDHWADFGRSIFYVEGRFDDPLAYERLKRKLDEVDVQFGIPGSRIFYMSIPPQLIEVSVNHLKTAGMVHPPEEKASYTRIICEKPIGRDLDSARAINAMVAKVFDESQTYRIDHYLGKETVQNLLVLRFANSIFEPLWNGKYIDHVQITVAEEEGLSQYDADGRMKTSRVGYFEGIGNLRDMVQNHLLQVLCMVAMEPPWSLDPDVVRDAKSVVLRCLRPLKEDEVDESVVRAEYAAGEINGRAVPEYRQEVRDFCERANRPVPDPITTETYVAMRVHIDNWRWSGVPFYLRTGKRLPKRSSEVAITFKAVPSVLFNQHPDVPLEPTVLSLKIQPEEGLSLRISSKLPGPKLRIYPVKMDFNYGTSFGGTTPEAYERLILDVMAGDPTLFMRRDAVEAAWEYVMPILNHWEKQQLDEIPTYQAGTWGPEVADKLIEADDRQWRRCKMQAIDTIEVGGSLESANDVPLDKVESELASRLQIAQLDAREPVRRVRMSNLIIVCHQTDTACAAEAQVPEIVGYHPARVTLLVTEPEATEGVLRASVLVRKVRADPRLVSEQVTLHAGGAMIDQLPFAVRSLLIGDLPTNLWWACSIPPPFAGKLLADLAGSVQQLIYDSRGWIEPNQGVASTSTWLDGFERGSEHGRWRIASDINWRRLKTWRRILTQGLDPASAPGFLDKISEVTIEHGPHGVTQAWQIAGWLASRMGWHYQASKFHDNVEIAFQFRAPHGWVTLRIDRLTTGPSAIQRIKISAGFEGQDGELEFSIEDNRLSVCHVGKDETPRTVTLPSQRLGELIGRQLSDREPDPIFRESMRLAQKLARHVVGDPDQGGPE